MPELPDLTVYLEALSARILNRALVTLRIRHPFLLRSVDPPVTALHGRRVTGLARLGKRIVLHFEGDLHCVLHLMIAGRLHWRDPGRRFTRATLCEWEFETGTLGLTEAGSRKRASLHVVAGAEALSAHDPGGLEPLSASAADFRARLRDGNRTLKRALTEPRRFAGIGNAYSDEILHRARLSPLRQTQRLDDAEIARLYDATRAVLQEWTARLREAAAGGFPEKVTAFRAGMAAHGRHGQPCPDCATLIQRIRYAEHETNYCPRCQTEGRLLADRALSRLLKDDWPRTIDEWEQGR